MELRQLRYFVAVADTLNFSRASESLYVSQSALSKQVAELEQELGVLLLERDRRSVRLTPAGELLLPEAKSILMQSEKIVPLLRHQGEETAPPRSVHISVEPRAAHHPAVQRLLTDGVYRQRRRTPGLRALFWQHDHAELKRALQEEAVDLGIFLHSEDSLGDPFQCRTLRQDELVLVFRSDTPYPDTQDSIRELLKKRGLILVEKDARVLTQALALLDGIGASPQIRFCRDSTAMILTMESGESTAILPASQAALLAGDDLQTLHFRHPAARLYLLCAWLRDTKNDLPRLLTESVCSRME